MLVRPELSIILPVYNGELFLERAIKSVLDQIFVDWELIIINDGSTDRTEEILLSYAACDSRINYYSQPNRGLSAARNAGLDKANGEYVVFLDADDFLETNYYSELLASAERSGADFIVSSYVRDFVQPNGKINSETIHFEQLRLDSVKLKQQYSKKKFFYNVYIHVWNKIYKKDFLDKHGIAFDEKIRYAEDVPFNICSLIKADSILFLDIPGYHYVCHQAERLTGSWKQSLLEDNCRVYRQIANFEKQYLDMERSEVAAGMYLRSCFLAIEKTLSAQMSYRDIKKIIKTLFQKNTLEESLGVLQKSCKSKEFYIYKTVLQLRSPEMLYIAVKLRRILKGILGR